jgi:hypothetical protein
MKGGVSAGQGCESWIAVWEVFDYKFVGSTPEGFFLYSLVYRQLVDAYFAISSVHQHGNRQSSDISVARGRH